MTRRARLTAGAVGGAGLFALLVSGAPATTAASSYDVETLSVGLGTGTWVEPPEPSDPVDPSAPPVGDARTVETSAPLVAPDPVETVAPSAVPPSAGAPPSVPTPTSPPPTSPPPGPAPSEEPPSGEPAAPEQEAGEQPVVEPAPAEPADARLTGDGDPASS